MTIVAMAFDQSPNNTGWAIGKPLDTRPLFGKFALPPWGREEPARVLAFKKWLYGMLIRHGVTHLFYEKPVPAAGLGKAIPYISKRGPNAGKMSARVINQKDPAITDNQAAMRAMIWLASAELRLPVREIDVNDMRQYWIGCRRVAGLQGEAHTKELKKLAMRSCAMAGYLVDDHDTAEAIGHLHYALSTLDRNHAISGRVLASRAESAIWNGREA